MSHFHLSSIRVLLNISFRFSREIKDWKITDRLHLINVPTLVIRGEYDMGQAFVSEGFVQRILGVKLAHFKNSSHTPHWEEREKYMVEVEAFLNDGHYQ